MAAVRAVLPPRVLYRTRVIATYWGVNCTLSRNKSRLTSPKEPTVHLAHLTGSSALGIFEKLRFRPSFLE